MDRKSIIVLVVCFLLLMSWPALVNKIYPPKRLPPKPATTQTSPLTVTNGAGVTVTSTPPVLEPAPVTPRQPLLEVSTNAPEELLEVTNRYAHYTFTSRGGGLQQIELPGYPETVATRRTLKQKEQRSAVLSSASAPSTLSLLGLDNVDAGSYKLTQTATGARAERVLSNGLSIVKIFELGSNYLLTASVRIENTSSQPVALPAQEWVAGTATPMNAQDNGSIEAVMWYDGAKAQDIVGASHFATTRFGCFPRVPPTEYRGGQTNVAWVAPHNQFFALAVMPQDPARELVIRKVDLPRPSEEEARADSRIVRQPQGYLASLVYPGQTLAPRQAIERKVSIYAGPKEYRTLATISATYNNGLDAIMGFGGFFGFFSKALLLGMNWIHSALHFPYGWAIIAITLIIKLAFWPLTQASTRSMKKMQALQPQVKALQEKYKDDPVKAQRKMMEFWKENKVSPMSGCLPMLIQMPVFIGFFYMIRSAIELRGAPFLWVGDLSRPDTLFLIPGLNFPFNLLPLIMGGTMLWQAHLTPPSPGMDPAQAKLMRYLPLMFMVFLYNFSAGLTLYWTVQNLLTIAQTKLTKTAPTAPAQPQVLTPAPKKRK